MRRLAAAVLTLLTLAATGCGGDDPPSALEPRQRLDAGVVGSPAPLRRLQEQASEILGGGPSAFERQVDALDGYPIVVNKWASWCGPCRLEFPFFQRLARKQAKLIAFLGVDSLDARGDALRFLGKLPLPYPSFFDPDGDVAKVFRGQRVFPTTAFYDRRGELAYTKQGPYTSERALADDIRQYAR